MDYEKKYKEALELAKDYFKANQRLGELEENDMLSDIFPELEESEDERIRKCIGDVVREHDWSHIFGVTKDDCLAWLKKQAEQKPIEMKTAEESLGIDSDTYNKIIDECIFGEQKSTDKVEPKFHEGDWVVQEKIGVYKVIEVCESWYEVADNKDKHYSIGFDKEYMCHLWTIQDAKDGDVLNSPTHHLIWIYKDIQHYHACVNMNYVKENFFTDGFIVTPTDVCPATKDEQTILFAKMKEAGYEWNAEKKELKKIEQKPTDEEIKTLLRTEYEKGRADAIVEMQNLAWSEEDEEFLRRAINATKDVYPMTAKWLKSLKGKVQPKQEWSEEDIRNIENIDSVLFYNKDLPEDTCMRLRNWLKSLKDRVQPKQEWNEEDESYLNTTIAYLKDAKEFKKTAENCMDWLKSLKERIKK